MLTDFSPFLQRLTLVKGQREIREIPFGCVCGAAKGITPEVQIPSVAAIGHRDIFVILVADKVLCDGFHDGFHCCAALQTCLTDILFPFFAGVAVIKLFVGCGLCFGA